MKSPMQNLLNFINVLSFTNGLQEVIDALSDREGVVEVPPRIYTMRRGWYAIHAVVCRINDNILLLRKSLWLCFG